MKNNFSMEGGDEDEEGGGGWFRMIQAHYLCTLFLLLLYQVYLTASGIKSQRLGASA